MKKLTIGENSEIMTVVYSDPEKTSLFKSGGHFYEWTDDIRHATDAEIKANRRLDLPDSIIQSLSEVP